MIAKKNFIIGPQIIYSFIMVIQLLILLIIIFHKLLNPMVFLLYLILIFSMVLRWRIKLKPCYMLIDLTFFLLTAAFYPPASIYLFVFAYYFSYKNKLIYTLPLIIVGLIVNEGSYYLLLLQGLLFGTILCHWERESTSNKNIMDHLRQHIYDLELVQSQLLSDYQDTDRISRLTERQRIAEVLHDSLGHELTAAHLSLKAYKSLIKSKQFERANITFSKSEKRLENALHQLKSSVKSIEPNLEIGLLDITNLCDNFIYPVEFVHSGNIFKLEPYIWQLILMSVREALTNITKHARPNKVNISLKITDYSVRMTIENDGIINNPREISGNGLRYMRNRLEAVNGSLSIQRQGTFKLIIFIPFERSK
ncbi:histidine kinase [Clostridium sp. C8]|jgi:signal transduction histidine kinase|uniref:sensor histidine kinase n=1 Tax=Clostridium sp. C8 TaxID=1667357 RepID=UPI00062E574D|nr:histidine kinase [Clostridium sp. C8]KLE16541.1 hypothetical protein AAT22_05430 [Clostridium sp. C8]